MSTFQLLNGLTFAALLFVVASGFTLIFGLLRIVNLAHGALYLFGGYIGFAVATKTGSFVLGGVSVRAGVVAIFDRHGALGPAATYQSAICAPVQNFTSLFCRIVSKMRRKYFRRCGTPMM